MLACAQDLFVLRFARESLAGVLNKAHRAKKQRLPMAFQLWQPHLSVTSRNHYLIARYGNSGFAFFFFRLHPADLDERLGFLLEH